MDALHLASLAKQALIDEAELTPKPGLVDRRGPGAHTDLSLELMRRSAESLEPFFKSMAVVSRQLPLGRPLREQLGTIGRTAERAMYMTTGGTNTHKGAIWVLGLLVAAASYTNEAEPFHLAKVAGYISRLPDLPHPELVSHGAIVRSRYGFTGARGEAYADFPHVIDIGLPALRAARGDGKSESASRLSALLSLMATLDDTCVLYRSGSEGAALVKAGARSVLAGGGPETDAGDAALHQFDQDLLARRVSPGGSADLLAATIFLDSLEWHESRATEHDFGGHVWSALNSTTQRRIAVLPEELMSVLSGPVRWRC
jgi:triphosphoribosyl-dephospho-CoA synthase